MKTYAVYEKSENDRVAVKVGFCWPGFIFSIWWLLCARLWERAGIFWGIALAVQLFAVPIVVNQHTISPSIRPFWVLVAVLVQSCAIAVISWIIGSRGNKWRRINLRARGFKHVITMEAESKDEAFAKLREMSVEELEKEAEEKKTAEAIKKALKPRPRV